MATLVVLVTADGAAPERHTFINNARRWYCAFGPLQYLSICSLPNPTQKHEETVAAKLAYCVNGSSQTLDEEARCERVIQRQHPRHPPDSMHSPPPPSENAESTTPVVEERAEAAAPTPNETSVSSTAASSDRDTRASETAQFEPESPAQPYRPEES